MNNSANQTMSNLQLRESVLSLCEDVVLPEQWECFRAGDTLVEAGEQLAQVYVIKTGLFKLSIQQEQASLTMGYFVKGDIAGLMGAESEFRYPYAIKAVVDTEVYVWDRSKILELMSLFPSIGNNLKSTKAILTNKIVDRLKSLVFYAPHQRVAAWVMDYSKFDIYYKNKIWPLLSSDEMAKYCNVNKETLEESLAEFSRAEIIEINENGCSVLDWKKLKFILRHTQ